MSGLGYKGYLGISEETVWGTKVLTSQDFAEFKSESLKKTVEEILSKGINSTRAHKRRLQGAASIAGDFSFEVNPDDVIGLLLKHTLWAEAVPVQQGSTAAYLHAFTPGATMPAGLTVQIGRDDSVFDYAGCKINNLKFKAAIKEILEATVSLVAKDEEIGSATSPSFSTANPFVFHQGVFTVGGTPVDVESFDLDIANQLKNDRRQLGSALILEPKEGKLLIKGSFKRIFDGAGAGTAYAKYIAGTAGALVLIFTGAQIASPYNYKLTITLPEVYYNGETPNISGPDALIEQTIPFQAIYNTTATNEIKIELINTRVTAY